MSTNGIGAMHSSISVKIENSSRPIVPAKSGFGSILSSIQETNQGTETKDTNINADLLTLGNIEELLTYLQNQDILDLEDGAVLLNKLLSDSNITIEELAQENLMISDEIFTSVLNSLKSIMGDIEKTLSPDINDKWRTLQLNLNDNEKLVNKMDDIAALLLIIQSLPNQQFQKLVDQDFEKLMKFTKMVDILSDNQDSYMQNPHFKKIIESLITKLDEVLKSSTNTFKADYLQKTFTLLSGDLKQNSKVNLNNSSKPIGELEQGRNLFGKPIEGLDSGINFIRQISKPEQLSMMLESSRKPVSTEQLIDQFESILAKSQFSKMNGTQKLLIKLTPEHLGSLRIELIQKDQMLIAKILTTTGAAKETLESQLNGLKQAMANQNIQVEKIDISQQMTPQDRTFQRESHQQEHGQDGSNRNQKQEQENDTQHEFNESLIEALLNTKV